MLGAAGNHRQPLDPTVRGLRNGVAPPKTESEVQACQQNSGSRTEHQIVPFPIVTVEITAAEKIVRHATTENHDGQKQPLMQEERTIQKQRGPEKSEDDGSPGGDHPFERKLKIKECHDGGGAQIREENVKMQAAVAAGVFFLVRQLRIDEEENQGKREDGVHSRTPEFAGFA